MIGFLRRLAARLTRRGRADAVPNDEWDDPDELAERALAFKGISLRTVYPVPTDRQVDGELQPVARARAAGAQNNPPSTQRELSADEDSIVLFFKQFLCTTEQTVFDALTSLRNDLERAQGAVAVPDVNRAFAKLDGELRTLKSAWTGRMIQAHRARLEAWRHLRHFRATHRINRSAAYPDAIIWDFMLLLALVLLETVGNAFFYQIGNEAGYIGGLVNALLISMVNVFIAFFALGFLSLRHLHVRPFFLRVLAALGAALSVGAIAVLNLAAAHYRDRLATGAGPELIDAVGAVFTKGFALTTLPALALLLFGYTLAAMAAYKGYYFDDPIPGFGRMTRWHERSKAGQHNTEAEFRAALNEAALRHATAAEREIVAFRRAVHGRQRALALYDQIRTYFPDYQRNVIQRLCDATLRRYREENARVRTSAIPAAFTQYPTIFVEWTPPDLPADLRDLQREIAELRAAGNLFTQLHKEFHDRVELFYAGIESEIEQIESMARNRLDRQEPFE